MANILEYAPSKPPSIWLRRTAIALLFSPLLTLVTFYGEWLLAWYSLGHRPISSLDDPKSIPGSAWLHDITGLCIFTLVPLGVVMIVLNVIEIRMNRPKISHIAVRMAIVLICWLALFGVGRFIGKEVGNWWWD